MTKMNKLNSYVHDKPEDKSRDVLHCSTGPWSGSKFSLKIDILYEQGTSVVCLTLLSLGTSPF